MPSRNIAVQETVYEALLKEKRAGESFTSVLRRLLDQRGGSEESPVPGVWETAGHENAFELSGAPGGGDDESPGHFCSPRPPRGRSVGQGPDPQTWGRRGRHDRGEPPRAGVPRQQGTRSCPRAPP